MGKFDDLVNRIISESKRSRVVKEYNEERSRGRNPKEYGVSTGLYSDRALEILSVMNAASVDFTPYTICKVLFEHSDDGEISFSIMNEGSREPLFAMWQVAGNIRENVERHGLGDILEDRAKASPDTFEIKTRGGGRRRFEIRELNCILDFLEGRPAAEIVGEYGKGFVDKLVGQPRNPLETGTNKLRREEAERLRKGYSAEAVKLKDMFLAGEIGMAEYKRKDDELQKKYDDADNEAWEILGIR